MQAGTKSDESGTSGSQCKHELIVQNGSDHVCVFCSVCIYIELKYVAIILSKVGEDPLDWGEMGGGPPRRRQELPVRSLPLLLTLLHGFLFWPKAPPTVSCSLVLEFRQVPAPQLECTTFVEKCWACLLTSFFSWAELVISVLVPFRFQFFTQTTSFTWFFP